MFILIPYTLHTYKPYAAIYTNNNIYSKYIYFLLYENISSSPSNGLISIPSKNYDLNNG